MAIYITGDIHSDVFSRFSSRVFPEGKTLTKEDYVVILGDFGCVWCHDGETPEEKYKLDWLQNKPWTTLFVDGNHENFDRLDNYLVEDWCGGKVHKIRPNVIHLMRGYVFDIDHMYCFTFGGARSHDIKDGILEITEMEKIKRFAKDQFKLFRINKYSWWEQEMPNQEEMDRGLVNLAKHNNLVDFIFTHDTSASTLRMMQMSGMLFGPPKMDELNNYLETVRSTVDYGRWFFGHHHDNQTIPGTGGKDRVLYDDIERIW